MIPKVMRSLAAAGLLSLWLVGCAVQGRPPGQLRCNAEADAFIEAGDWQQGLIAHEKLLAQEPSNCLALFHTGYIWGVLGERLKEIEYYKRAQTCGLDRDDRLYFNLGMALAAVGDLPSARQALQKAIDLNPDNADNHFGLGLIHRDAGSIDQALHALQKAVAVDSRHWEARAELTRLYLDQGNWQAAQDQISALERAGADRIVIQQLRDMLRRRRIE